MYVVDLHAHTRFFHVLAGRPTLFDPLGAELLSAVAERRGLDGVAVTNHDYAYRPDAAGERADRVVAADGEGADRVVAADGEGGTLADPGVTTIPGNEVSTTRGHVLVVGPDPPEATRPGALTPEEVVDLAHDRDCVAVVAHPLRNSTVQATTAPFDAVELNGKTPDTHDRARWLAEQRDLPLVGGSDAHWPFEVGRARTLVDAPELTPASVVEAVRDGRVEPVVEPGHLHAALEPLYDLVHRAKDHR